MKLRYLKFIAMVALLWAGAARGQGPVKITLDQAVQSALEHNHALQAARTAIAQNQAQEVTANLRPNPVLQGDAQFLPLFKPSLFTHDYLDQSAQFDLGIGYLFERGGKRQHRLQAARDVTAQTKFVVADNERSLAFSVATQFVNALLAQSNVDFALEGLKSFQDTVDISQSRYKAGDISEGDFLKIKIQMLQFETDVSAARLAKVQALVALRELLGYESAPADYDVAGELEYQPVKAGKEDLQAQALANRPDLRAAQQGVVAAESQYQLARANSKRDVGASINYTHVAALSTTALFFNMQIPIFDRNQGELARTRSVITQTQEQASAAAELAMGDVAGAYEGLRSNDAVVTLYRSGYLDQAKQSRDIDEYAYKRGAASLLDFLDAERSYRATQLAYRQTLAGYMLALEQLREAVGMRNLP